MQWSNIFEGEYNGREDIQGAQMIRILGRHKSYMQLYKNLGYRTLEELTKEKFKRIFFKIKFG